MKTTTMAPRRFEFCYPQLDTLIQVEEIGRAVVIRSTRDTFNEQRKQAFVRELAAEGFIADEHRWDAIGGGRAEDAVRWIIDCSWLEIGEEVLARSRRFMTRLLVSSTIVWIAAMSVLMLCSLPH